MKSTTWNWRDSVAIVTGAAQGMGYASAHALARLGASVVMLDRNPEIHDRSHTLSDEGLSSMAVEADVSSSSDWSRVMDELNGRFGRVDVLVHAAGILKPTPILEMQESEWESVLRVNLTGAFLATRAVAVSMKARGIGRIVLFSSTAGKTVSTIGGAHYTASKHGVLGLTRAAAKEFAAYGITVNAVCPGLVDTEMVRQTIEDAAVANYASSFPIARLGAPEEVAKLVVFLVESSYITGAAVDINGGDLMV